MNKAKLVRHNKPINNSNDFYTLLAVIYGKLLCKVGWHNFTCTLQECIDEFGCLPLDGRMSKKAKRAIKRKPRIERVL